MQKQSSQRLCLHFINFTGYITVMIVTRLLHSQNCYSPYGGYSHQWVCWLSPSWKCQLQRIANHKLFGCSEFPWYSHCDHVTNLVIHPSQLAQFNHIGSGNNHVVLPTCHVKNDKCCQHVFKDMSQRCRHVFATPTCLSFRGASRHNADISN